jgi:deoxyxylulose-5-phosphate synthase
MGVPDVIITHGDPKGLLAEHGLDADGIYARTKEAIENIERQAATKPRLKAVK